MPDAIIQPRRGRTSLRLGPVAVLSATEVDLELLRGVLGFEADEGRRLHVSRLFTASAALPGLCLAGPMIGAPYAVMIAETLVAWGAVHLLFFGWCGAISDALAIGDLVVPTAAFIDEGTSRHYAALTDVAASPGTLADRLAAACTQAQIAVHRGPVWTTDAPFRETRDKLLEFRRRGALAVEMECSALFTLAAFRAVEAAALLVVSDDLSSLAWKPGFKDPRFASGCAAAGRVIRALGPLLAAGGPAD